MEKYDFSGWATKNDLECSDGRIIRKDAFKHNDGQTVPLVWNHDHTDPYRIVGHALLENRAEGVYAYCSLNDTDLGQTAKTYIMHGDITQLSIYANQLKQQGPNVMHGTIREVSLVLAGANPEAYIDSIMMHGEDSEEAIVLYTGENIVLSHADKKEEEPVVKEDNAPENKENNNQTDDKTIKDVFDSMSDEQKQVVYAMIGMALEDAGVDSDENENKNENENSEGGTEDMKHNVFENDTNNNEEVLSHDAMTAIMGDAKRYGSLKESFLAHADEYGIESIDYLFPDAKTVTNAPDLITRDMGWVQKVMNATHHTPFSRIKSVAANITEDEARARGYIKGKLKKEEVFSLLKRTTSPTTIYKKQKIDRDDMIDITDFDVVAWLKSEMRMMLDEEIARAVLVGDGRLASSDDKIKEDNVRPIWKDEDLYTIKYTIDTTMSATGSEKAKAFIVGAIKARKDYKGSGEPTLFTTEDVVTDCLLLEDTTGRLIYDSIEKLATTLRVKEIVTVPVMEGLSRTNTEGDTCNLMGIIVNLVDYNIGADKGGSINMFDDFDIDYNQQKYLIETRCSGALIKPYSAIALEIKTPKSSVVSG